MALSAHVLLAGENPVATPNLNQVNICSQVFSNDY